MYKTGDKVRIQPREWYEKSLKNTAGSVQAGADLFTKKMSVFCGREATIISCARTEEGPLYSLNIKGMNTSGFRWTEGMFDPHYHNLSAGVRSQTGGLKPMPTSEDTLNGIMESINKHFRRSFTVVDGVLSVDPVNKTPIIKGNLLTIKNLHV